MKNQSFLIQHQNYSALALLIFAPLSPIAAQEITAKAYVQKSHDLFLGQSSISDMTMTITRPTWSRTISMQNWSLGQDYYITYITSPAEDKGQVFLKAEKDMWNYMPSVNRMIKIPPSMMMQSWMGSDFTNNDLMKENSMVTDYTHTFAGSETIEGYDCVIILLDPKPEAPVVWGKIKMWIAKTKYFGLKVEYYDTDQNLIKTETASDIKQMGKREIPTHLVMIPENKKGNSTVMDINYQEFDVKGIDTDFFSIQNIKRLRPR